MSFKDIKGQDRAISFLKSAIGSDRVSHAYMFIGPPGVGKRLAAVNFAKAINCLDRKEGEPCGSCAQCKKIDSANHPDVLVFSPLKDDSGFGIDKIRALTKDIGLRPYEAKRKVYILDGADSMTQEAQNALLKTLEEPPSDSIMILIVKNPDAVFSTIQSRAKKVKFFPLSAQVVKDILVDTYKLDSVRSEILARISSGELGRALRYNEEGFFEKRSRIIGALSGGNLLDSELDGLSRSDLKLALDVMLTWYRDILVAKSGYVSKSLFVNVDKLEAIGREASAATFDTLNNMINQIILTGSFLEQNANPKLAMGVLGVSLLKPRF